MPIVTLDNRVNPQAAPNFQRQALRSTVGEDLGQGLGVAADVVNKVRQEEALKADRAAFMDADRVTDTVANDLITNTQKLQGKDAIGASTKALEDFDKQTADVLNGLKNPRQQAVYKESVNARRSSLQRQMQNHEGQQTEAYYAKSREDYKDQAHINAVTNYQDPKAIAGEIDKIRATLAQTPGMDDAQRDTELGIRRAGIYAGVVDRYLANDQVGKARKYYETIKDQAGAKAAYIENRINDTSKALEARAKAQAAEARAGRVLSAYASEGPEAGVAAMTALVKSGKLTQEQLGDVYSKVQQGLSLARNAKQEEHADEIANINQNLSNGSSDLNDMLKVEELWKDGTFSPTERASLVGRIEASHIAKASSQAANLALQEALQNGTPLSPSNAEHRKVLAAAFGAETLQTPVGSAQFQQLATAYAVKTRMLPEQASQWAQAAVRSPNATIAAAGAQFVGAVQSSAPDAVSSFDTDTKAFAGMISSMIDAGTDPAEAVETARETVFNTKPQIVEARKTAYSTGRDALALQSNGALNSFIDRDFDTAFSSQPSATLELQADFNRLTERYFLKTGDLNVSRENAWRDVRRAYGPSEVNGAKMIMLAPPEKFGVQPQEIRKDIGLFLADNPQADGTTAEDVVIVPDSQTMRAVNDIVDGKPGAPSYKMTGRSGDLLIDKNGVRHRYFMPSGEEFAARVRDAQAKATEAAKKQVDEARAERAGLQEFTRRTYEDYGQTGGLH